MADIYDCIVVGAGYAGLSAAKRLVENNKRVLLLEARDRVGGRVWTKQNADGSYDDYGGAWLGVQQPNMYKLANEFGVSTFDTLKKGKSILHYRGKVKPYSSPLIPPFNLFALLDSMVVVTAFERLSRGVNLEEPWKTKDAKRLDQTTVEEWLRAKSWSRSTKAAMRMAMGLLLGVDASQVSMLHALWYCKSGISFTVLSTLEGAQNQRVVGGAQSMADCMRDTLGDAVRLEEPVVAIDQRDDNAVVVTTSKGVHRGRSVILAVPPQLALQMNFSPVLPAQKMKLLHNMPMGAYWKVFATYDTPFWREDGYRGEVVAPDCYMTFISDATPASEKHGVLMGFVVASKAMEWLDMPQDKRDEIALRELAACYGPRAGSPQKLNMHTMMEDKWSGGCPVAVPTPGQWTSLGHWIRKPIGKIHWAGTETAIHWSGYMEGAVNSGLRAADEVVAVLGAGSASKSGSGSGTPPVLSP